MASADVQEAELLAQDGATFAPDDGDVQDGHYVSLALLHTVPSLSVSLLWSLPDVIRVWWHLAVLLPSVLVLSALSHLMLPRTVWQRCGGPKRVAWPVSRSKGWSVRETAAVAVVGHLLAAFRHASRTPLCPSAERLIPILSHSCFGIKHQGWSLSGKAIPLEELAPELAIDVPAPSSGKPARNQDELIAMLLWKAQASSVHHHKVQSIKPTISVGGVGSGPARRGERVLLILSGASYADRDPTSGLFACNAVNITGLRALCVNWRKTTPCSAGEHGAFPAGLNDAIRAYVHLVRNLRFNPTDICLLAEGSGAGVAMGLMLWLSALQAKGLPDEHVASHLGRPGRVILWSPWCDLSMRSPTWKANAAFDITSYAVATKARDSYMSSLPVRSTLLGDREQHGVASHAAPLASWNAEPDSPTETAPRRRHPWSSTRMARQETSGTGSDSGVEIEITRPASVDDPAALAKWAAQTDDLCGLLVSTLPLLGVEHPLLSPGLPGGAHRDRAFHRAVFSLLRSPLCSANPPDALAVASSALSKTDYLIFCGTESVLEGEAASLARNIKVGLGLGTSHGGEGAAGDSTEQPRIGSVTYLRALETPTLFNLMPTSVFLPEAQAKAEELVQKFLVGDAHST
ncbi:unnamed protein product [Parajaminaea phylloscopi]